MGQVVEEVKIWNTPIAGAFLLWKFTCGYIANHPKADAPIGLLHFVAIGILANQETLEQVDDRKTNLPAYVRWFEENKKVDLLLEVQERIKEKRDFTWRAIDIAIANGLLAWDVNTGKLHPRTSLAKSPPKKGLKLVYERQGKKAEVLGKWFAQLDLRTIASYLKIVF